jgi:cell division protein FtsL
MTSWLRFFSLGLIAVSMIGLYALKLNVKDMQDQIADLDAQIAQHQETMHVLQAEVAYLTRPERLSALQELYFPDMKPVIAQQVTLWLPVATQQRSAPTLLASSDSFGGMRQ